MSNGWLPGENVTAYGTTKAELNGEVGMVMSVSGSTLSESGRVYVQFASQTQPIALKPDKLERFPPGVRIHIFAAAAPAPHPIGNS